MLVKTKGVVFRLTPYGDTSVIVNVFTDLFGLQSYIVNGVRSNSKKSRIALFQPLTLLDLVVYHKENGNIMRMKEVKCYHPYSGLIREVHKSAIALFINEVLNKSVKEQSHASEIFEFIAQSLVTLDNHPKPENFHLIFLLGLSRHLGFAPNQTSEVLGAHWMDEQEERLLDQLLHTTYHSELTLTYSQRQSLLNGLLRFYQTHIDGFGEIKSLAVLQEVLR
ncbi:MAG: DNA repair protein RecO [Cyclobacteriaceae bacterium]|nr:DNA repair protein RecO [Cyclobacteriaceae bacterium]